MKEKFDPGIVKKPDYLPPKASENDYRAALQYVARVAYMDISNIVNLTRMIGRMSELGPHLLTVMSIYGQPTRLNSIRVYGADIKSGDSKVEIAASSQLIYIEKEDYEGGRVIKKVSENPRARRNFSIIEQLDPGMNIKIGADEWSPFRKISFLDMYNNQATINRGKNNFYEYSPFQFPQEAYHQKGYVAAMQEVLRDLLPSFQQAII